MLTAQHYQTKCIKSNCQNEKYKTNCEALHRIFTIAMYPPLLHHFIQVIHLGEVLLLFFRLPLQCTFFQYSFLILLLCSVAALTPTPSHDVVCDMRYALYQNLLQCWYHAFTGFRHIVALAAVFESDILVRRKNFHL